MSNLINGQTVKVHTSFNQFKACNDTKYCVVAINKIQGEYCAVLRLNGQIVGAIPERKLSAN